MLGLLNSSEETQCLIDTPFIDLCKWVFLSGGCFPRRTAVALKFTLRLKVEWQGERERTTRDISIMALEDLKGGVDKHVDHMPDNHTNGWLLLNIHLK